MKSILLYILIFVLCISSADSDGFVKSGIYANGRLEVGATGGINKYFGEFTDNNVGYNAGFYTRYFLPFIPEIGFGARIQTGALNYDRRFKQRFGSDFYRQFPKSNFPDADIRSYPKQTTYTTFDGLIFLNLFPRARLNYNLFFGISALTFQNDDIVNSPIRAGGGKLFYPEWKDEDQFDVNLVGGMGIDFFITQDFSVGIMASYRMINTDYLDGYAQINDLGEETNPDGVAELGLKLSYHMFTDNDPDDDGVPNEVEEENGTDPFNYDSDNDGVSDGDEIKVHNSNPLLSDTDGDGLSDGEEIKANTNLLNSDTDEDGLTDYEEVKVHNTVPFVSDSDKDGLDDLTEIKNGTKPLNGDTDSDGISDGEDNCPTIPGLKILKGCPKTDPTIKEKIIKDTVYVASKPDTVIIVQEIEKIKKGETYTPKGILFETASANIRLESELILDNVVAWLRSNENLKVEIQGHTDQQGSSEFNKKLSKDRAEAVKLYLISKGIDSKRLTTKGFGESKLIDNSGTKKAMAKNRRIEFKVNDD